MIPEEKIMLPTRAPAGMGAVPCDTPGISIERGFLEFITSFSGGGYGLFCVNPP
jgi:hypothetical protein